MVKAKFVHTTEFTAVQFNPEEHPWHHSVQRQTIDGKIPEDFEGYFCIIPCDTMARINPGDWIAVDDSNNARFIVSERNFEMMGIERKSDC